MSGNACSFLESKDYLGFPGGAVKNPPANAGDMGSIPGWGRSPGGRHSNPLQYSFLENSMDRGAWRATAMELQRVGHDWVRMHAYEDYLRNMRIPEMTMCGFATSEQ